MIESGSVVGVHARGAPVVHGIRVSQRRRCPRTREICARDYQSGYTRRERPSRNSPTIGVKTFMSQIDPDIDELDVQEWHPR